MIAATKSGPASTILDSVLCTILLYNSVCSKEYFVTMGVGCGCRLCY